MSLPAPLPGRDRERAPAPRPPIAPATPSGRAAEGLDDLRFRALVGAHAWAGLPAAVRARFGHRLGPGETVPV